MKYVCSNCVKKLKFTYNINDWLNPRHGIILNKSEEPIQVKASDFVSIVSRDVCNSES